MFRTNQSVQIQSTNIYLLLGCFPVYVANRISSGPSVQEKPEFHRDPKVPKNREAKVVWEVPMMIKLAKPVRLRKQTEPQALFLLWQEVVNLRPNYLHDSLLTHTKNSFYPETCRLLIIWGIQGKLLPKIKRGIFQSGLSETTKPYRTFITLGYRFGSNPVVTRIFLSFCSIYFQALAAYPIPTAQTERHMLSPPTMFTSARLPWAIEFACWIHLCHQFAFTVNGDFYFQEKIKVDEITRQCVVSVPIGKVNFFLQHDARLGSLQELSIDDEENVNWQDPLYLKF